MQTDVGITTQNGLSAGWSIAPGDIRNPALNPRLNLAVIRGPWPPGGKTARALSRALRQYLGIPPELVVYPGAAHGLSTYEHRKAKMEWDLAWFERYLGASEEAESR